MQKNLIVDKISFMKNEMKKSNREIEKKKKT